MLPWPRAVIQFRHQIVSTYPSPFILSRDRAQAHQPTRHLLHWAAIQFRPQIVSPPLLLPLPRAMIKFRSQIVCIIPPCTPEPEQWYNSGPKLYHPSLHALPFCPLARAVSKMQSLRIRVCPKSYLNNCKLCHPNMCWGVTRCNAWVYEFVGSHIFTASICKPNHPNLCCGVSRCKV